MRSDPSGFHGEPFTSCLHVLPDVGFSGSSSFLLQSTDCKKPRGVTVCVCVSYSGLVTCPERIPPSHPVAAAWKHQGPNPGHSSGAFCTVHPY